MSQWLPTPWETMRTRAGEWEGEGEVGSGAEGKRGVIYKEGLRTPLGLRFTRSTLVLL
jgi:hypothetical protein